MLTASADNFVGTEKGDVFKADSFVTGFGNYITTLNSSDELDGGAGIDTLAITDDSGSGFTLATATISNIENMTIRGDSTVTADVSGSNVTGLNTVSVTQAADDTTVTASATQDVNVSGVVNADADISVIGGKTVTINHKLDHDADSISTVGAVNVAITATDVETASITAGTVGATTENTGTVTITSTGEAIDAATDTDVMAAINVAGGTTISVTQSATSDMGAVATDTSAQTITGGAVTILGGATTTSVTVVQDEAVAAVAAVAAAGTAQTQTVTFTALAAKNSVTVNGLTFTAAKNLTAAEVAQAFADLTSGDLQGNGGSLANGTYSGVNTATTYTTGAAVGATVTYTANVDLGAANNNGVGQTLATSVAQNGGATAPTAPTVVISNAGVINVPAVTGVLGVTNGAVVINDDAAAADTITSITIDGYNGGATLGNINSLDALTTLSLANSGYTGNEGAVTLTSASKTLNVTVNDVNGAVNLGGNVTTLNLTASTANSTFASMTAGALTTLNVSGNAAVTTTSNLGALTTVTVAGSAGLTLAAANSATITSVDASATSGKVTTVIDGDIATYKGGSGVDTLTVDAASTINVAKAITLGAGNDTITLGAITIGAGTIDGGADTDTISITAAAAQTASGNTTFAGKVTNFEQLTLTGATGAQTIDAAKLGNYNYVTVTDGAVATATTTLTGLTSGATIALNDAVDGINANDTIVATIKDATLVANTSDVLNIAISAKAATAGAVADDNGTVTAAGVETINISVLDAVNEATAVGAAVGTKNKAADTQNLTLQATSAKTITITGDTALNLTNNANTAVSLIDASTMTAGLTVTAAGTVASTIKGGSGNDVLTASTGVAGIVGAVNATGTSAAITNDVVAGVAGVKAVYTINLNSAVANDAGDTVTFNNGGVSGVYTAAGAETATQIASAMILAGTITIDSVVYDVTAGGNTETVVLTAQTAVTEAANMVVTVVDDAAEGGITQPAGTPYAITTAGVTAVQEQVTVVLTDGTTNTGLTAGDTMALAVDGTTYTYTAASNVTMDVAAAGLAALIDAGTHSAAYVAGTDTLTITAATGTSANLSVGSYTVTDAMSSGTVVGDTLIGGAGNDTLYAGNLAQLTGGAGNDKFVMNVPTNVNSYSTITDLSSGDVIQLTAGESFASTAVTLASTAVFQDYANAAVNLAATNDVDNTWFQFGGNTYVVANDSQADATNANFENGIDGIIQITGLVDLSTASYNQANGTLEIA